MATANPNGISDKVLTADQWNNPSSIIFTNTEIPASDIELDEELIETIVSSYQLSNNTIIS